jgi:stage V sporulation protein D (sporulation-specific penicillin-binding protein)
MRMATLRNMRASSTALSKARPDASRRRALAIISLLVFWMLVITTRLVYLQTFQHETLARRARLQQQDAVETSPMRGVVLDRQGRELARSIDTESFFAVPLDVKDEDAGGR